jgi:hypothetical protein
VIVQAQRLKVRQRLGSEAFQDQEVVREGSEVDSSFQEEEWLKKLVVM